MVYVAADVIWSKFDVVGVLLIVGSPKIVAELSKTVEPVISPVLVRSLYLPIPLVRPFYNLEERRDWELSVADSHNPHVLECTEFHSDSHL